MNALPRNESAKSVAIVEPQISLAQEYASDYHLDSKLFYTDIERMIAAQHPDAVLVYTTIEDHRKVIEMAAHHGISPMVEKPLSTTLEDAVAIRSIAREHHVQVLVNYETTWYSSNHELLQEWDRANWEIYVKWSFRTGTKVRRRSASGQNGCPGSPIQ